MIHAVPFRPKFCVEIKDFLSDFFGRSHFSNCLRRKGVGENFGFSDIDWRSLILASKKQWYVLLEI